MLDLTGRMPVLLRSGGVTVEALSELLGKIETAGSDEARAVTARAWLFPGCRSIDFCSASNSFQLTTRVREGAGSRRDCEISVSRQGAE